MSPVKDVCWFRIAPEGHELPVGLVWQVVVSRKNPQAKKSRFWDLDVRLMSTEMVQVR